MKPKKSITPKPKSNKGFKLRSHVRISIEDLNWLVEQEPCVKHLYLECAKSEQFGDHPRELSSTLSINSFKKAAKALQGKGLFEFEPIAGKLPSGKTGVIGYRVKNLHGSSNHSYWRINTDVDDIVDENETVTASKFDDDDQVLTLDDQNLTLTEAESIDTASFQFSSQPFSQEKEIKNKEKTAKRGSVERPKLAKDKNYLRPRQIGMVNFDLVTTWEQIQYCLSTIKSSAYVSITWHWEDLDDFVQVYITEERITREDFEEMKLDCSYSYVSQEYNSVKWLN